MKRPNILLKTVLFIAVTIVFGCLAQESRAATYTVNSTSDIQDSFPGNGICQTSTPGICTLRAAITEANALSGDDVISLPAGTFTITLSSSGENNNAGGDFDITSNITINGAGANSTFIQAASSAGAATDRVFHLIAGTVNIKGVTLRYGKPETGDGGAIFINSNTNFSLNESNVSSNSAEIGGGIYNNGTSTLTNIVISNNTALDGGGVYNITSSTLTLTNTTVNDNAASTNGGGIYNSGTMTLTSSTVNSNTASIGGTFGNGAGFFNLQTLTLTNTTVSNNSARSNGGGIFSNGTLTLTSSTINDNAAGGGGGIFFIGTANLRNTIIANSRSGGDCSRGANTTVNAQYSLIEGALGCFNGTNVNNLNADPMLGPLQNNGGPTQTHALLPGSPAIDKGNGFGLTIDQRALIRPVDLPSTTNASGGDGADIGAFEIQAIPTAASVTVSGRVLVGKHRGIFGATVYLTDSQGNTRATRANAFGYYRFEDVSAGETYVFNVFSKRYQFNPQVLTITEEMQNLDFLAEP